MRPQPSMERDEDTLQRIEELLRRRQGIAAEHAALAFTRARPRRPEGHVLLGRARQQRGDLAGALEAADQAMLRGPGDAAARMLRVELLLATGDLAGGTAALRELATAEGGNARLHQDLGQQFTHLGLHVEAERCYERATRLAPETPAYLYNWSTALIALGRLEQAEAVLDRVIALAPADHDAWYNRATLRRQTPARNHVRELEARLAQSPQPAAATAALGHALAKELEDLGEHARSFSALRRGADARRSLLSYRVEDDVETMQEIARVFDRAFHARAIAGHPDPRPVFILGLPRSGTTLVDRILGSHSAVRSRGETSDFALALVHTAGAAGSKAELIRRCADLDYAQLGANYAARLGEDGAARVLDKTPVNFLYLGLIARALPAARIVHVRRRPMDVCYAMYKTLFRMAYPYSYTLSDLAHYYLAYERLMAHWRAQLPGAFLDLDYELLVSAQEAQTRRLLEHAGLAWEPACLAFERNTSPSLTASAAQVRQPIYASSVGLWRRYERELEPLRERLRAGGIAVDD